ncbi:MAG: hypothetical protein AB7F23_04085 [Phycisphaerae bacterium]|jgi:vacuolar-type H+-ATPase subunit H
MELIKQIKDAERQAEEIVAGAREAAKAAELAAAAKRESLLEEAAVARRRLIRQASDKALEEGGRQAELIERRSVEECKALETAGAGELESAAEMILTAILKG